MTISLVLAYVPPNSRNKRQHWKGVMQEKHKAQAALLSALHSAALSSSTLTPNTDVSKTYWTAYNMLHSYILTGREKSVSK